jgi:hypothetical protein
MAMALTEASANVREKRDPKFMKFPLQKIFSFPTR